MGSRFRGTGRSRPRSHRLAAAGLTAVVLVALPGVSAAATGRNDPVTVEPDSPLCKPRAKPVEPGVIELQSARIYPESGGRMTDLTLDVPALNRSVHVNVLVPPGFDPSGSTRYPVLYLLHGGAGDYQGWRVLGDVQRVVDAATRDHNLPPFIVVMPEGGSQGWYTDWYGTDIDGHTPDPPPAWETFHVRELIPWIDANYPTVPDRSGRALAGLSMGGFGAMSYAARHPDVFVAAGSFSGAVHTNWRYPVMNLLIGEVVTAGATGGLPYQCIWGDPVTQQVRWREDDPTYIAENLDHLSLFLASGNGEPGPYDRGPNPLGSALEVGVWEQNKDFHQALVDEGVEHVTNFYGPGTHIWPYWQRELARFLPQMTAAFEQTPPAPPAVPFSFRSAAQSFSVWGWRFRTDHRVKEFTYLSDVDASGLQVIGSGTLTVTTAALYEPGSQWRITQGAKPQVVSADPEGRLTFAVYLGEPHTVQQYDFGPTATDTWAHAKVKIRPARVPPGCDDAGNSPMGCGRKEGALAR